MIGARPVWHGEHRDAARAQHAENLGERALVARQVFKHAERDHGIERAVCEGECFTIADAEVAATAQRMTLDARFAVRDHLRAEIDAPEFFRALEQRFGQHRRAAAHVQDPPEPRRQHLEREALLRGERKFSLPLARILARARVEVAADPRGMLLHPASFAQP